MTTTIGRCQAKEVDADHPEAELLEHLVIEFREDGQRVVDFLLTARVLLEAGLNDAPRAAQTVAYTLREALKTIPESRRAPGEGGEWRRLSRSVVDAKTRYELAATGLPGQDPQAELNGLLRAIDDLDRFHGAENARYAQLISVIVDRTGQIPYASGNALIREYLALVNELDTALHRGARIDAAAARQLYVSSVGLLRRLFTPPELRHAELEALAALPKPTAPALARVQQLIVSPQHLERFLRTLKSPAWLEILAVSDFVDPPEQDSWPGFAAVDALRSGHPSDVTTWLTAMYGRCGRDSTKAWYLLQAAVSIGCPARELILQVVKDHQHSASVRAVEASALDGVDPADPFVEALTDILLNPAETEPWALGEAAERLVTGITDDNGLRRLRTLSYKLIAADKDRHGWRWFTMDRTGTLASRTLNRREDVFDVLLSAFVTATQVVREAHGTAAVLEIVDTLPEEVRTRARSWLLGSDQAWPIEGVTEELRAAANNREPTGDDLALVDRVLAHPKWEESVRLVVEALGPPPTIAAVAAAIGQRDVEARWIRAYYWLGLLPNTSWGAWSKVQVLMVGAYGASPRVSLLFEPSVQGGVGRSPYTTEDLSALDPIDAARLAALWRPDPSAFMVGSRELARTVEATVQADPAGWLAQPLAMVTTLREPVYISHYLAGARAGASEVQNLQVDELMDVVDLVHAHPWEPVPLGNPSFDYDPNWRQTERESIRLLRALADSDVGYADRDDAAWDRIRTAVLDRTEVPEIGDSDALTAAINRACTQALEAAISFMAYETRRLGAPRDASFKLVEGTLRIAGADGAQHRAIIASRLGFFVAIAPAWMDANADLLFGSKAPGDLGQATIDLALKWSRPSQWLLEKFPAGVRDSARRSEDHALDHMLMAYLWELPGYSAEEVVGFLESVPGLISSAGRALGRMIETELTESVLDAAVEFWRAALEASTLESRAGFGSFVLVEGLDPDLWAELTLQTVQKSRGTIDFAEHAAKRMNTMGPSRMTLAIVDELVRHASESWERRRVAEHAVVHLDQATDLPGTPEYERLRTTLLERGMIP